MSILILLMFLSLFLRGLTTSAKMKRWMLNRLSHPGTPAICDFLKTRLEFRLGGNNKEPVWKFTNKNSTKLRWKKSSVNVGKTGLYLWRWAFGPGVERAFKHRHGTPWTEVAPRHYTMVANNIVIMMVKPCKDLLCARYWATRTIFYLSITRSQRGQYVLSPVFQF